MLEKLRLQLRRLRLRDTCSDHNYYDTCLPNEQKRYRLRRRVYSSQSLRRRYTYTPTSFSDTSFSDPEDLHWIQSPRARTRARTFTAHNSRSNFITVDMDRDRPRGSWRSIFGSEYFDIFQRRKKETRPRPRQPRDPYTYMYTRLVDLDPRYRDEYRWEGPRINPPRRAPSPPRARPPRRRGVSLPRRVVRSISPEPRLRPRSDEFSRRDIHRPQESVYTRPRAPPVRPARPSSPVNERIPIRRGRRISPFPPPEPCSRREVTTIIQRSPRGISPQTRLYPSSHPGPFRPHNVEIQTHNSIRERINRRKRIHSPETTSPPRSRKVRFVEGHEEIGGPVYFKSDSDSSSGSDSDCRPGSPPRASTQPRPRSRSRPSVVVVQPQRTSSARIIERSPRSSWPGGERRVSGLTPMGEMRGLSYRGQGRERQHVSSEGVMYEYREPRGQGRRVRDSRRYV